MAAVTMLFLPGTFVSVCPLNSVNRINSLIFFFLGTIQHDLLLHIARAGRKRENNRVKYYVVFLRGDSPAHDFHFRDMVLVEEV